MPTQVDWNQGCSSTRRRSFTSGKFLTIAVLLVAAWVGSAAVNTARADSGWKPASILNIAKLGTGQVVIAHRGVYGPGCPENSLCSIQQTYVQNVEGIELDVKQSKDGTPWLFHEQKVGRLIAHDPPFDPFQTPPTGWDPDVSTLTDAELGSSFLRDKSGATTGYRPMPLTLALATINSAGWNHMIIALDIKTLDAVSRSADIAIKYGLQDSVVLKFSSSLLAASALTYYDIKFYTKGVPFVPTVYAPDLTKILDGGWKYTACGAPSTEAYQCDVRLFLTGVKSAPGYAWLEVGNKMPVAGDPTNFLFSAGLGSLGAFQPVPEFPDRTGPGQSYVRSDGTCCAALTDYLTPATAYFPAEQQDGRENLSNLFGHGFSSLITDNPLAATRAATKRDTSQYA